jgi:hypothetical protein
MHGKIQSFGPVKRLLHHGDVPSTGTFGKKIFGQKTNAGVGTTTEFS